MKAAIPALLLLMLATTSALPAEGEVTLFNFNKDSDPAAWTPVNDGVMGGVSNSRFVRGPQGGALFTGFVSLENNGGFASVRSPALTADLTATTGVLLRILGDGKEYSLHLRTDNRFDGTTYKARFGSLMNHWTEVWLPFENFKPHFRGQVVNDAPPLDPGKIRSLSLMISDRQEGPFSLTVDTIRVRR